MNRRLLHAIACALGIAVAMPATAERKAKAATLGSLSQRAAPIDRSLPVQGSAEDATRSYEAYLALPDTDPTLEAQALRRLADLRLEQALALASGETVDPAAVQLAQEAAKAYRALLAEHPEYPAQDAVLYQLARAYEAAGEGGAAMATLDDLVTRFPSGAHADEAQFRRGEARFSAGRYADALVAYDAVLVFGPDSAFAEQALYKRGWAQYKLDEHDAASGSFLALLDRVLVADGQLREEAQLTRAEREIVDDTLRALSLMFAANEGATSLQAALAGRGAAPYEVRLYRALGDLYVEKERYQDGAEAYRAFARRQPEHPEAPLLLGAATDAYARAGFVALVLESKQELVELYGPRSASWAARGGAANLDPRVSAALQANLLDLARHHHALAQKSGDAAQRDLAVRWYREYLEGFDALPGAPAIRLLLADLLFEAERYAEAADEYERVAYGYVNPGDVDAARAGYAALVALDKVASTTPAEARPALDGRVVRLSLAFADAFPAHAETPAVLTRTTSKLFDAGDRVQASAVAERVLALGSRADAGQQLVAWTVLAHTAFDAGRYDEAERAYAEVLARAPTTDPLHAEATERLAASVYRQAEQRQAAGDVQGAVDHFLRVARVTPASPVRAQAEYDAAALLLGAGRWSDAAVVLERFRVDHPEHALVREVPGKLAVAYVEAGQPGRAAAEYERIAAAVDEPIEVRRAASWQAAELYAGAGDRPAATRAYVAYVQQFPAPVGPALEARQVLAEYAREANDPAARTRWLAEIVAAEGGAGAERTDRTRTLGANASLELARPLDAQARAIRLGLPLERSFAAKRKALEAALDAYTQAQGYGVAPVATAATYAMADLYRDLGRALLDSDRPTGLDEEELEQYVLLLEEQAFPFEEKAIGLHERNARLAAQGVYDEWVRRSFDELAKLLPARYARVERFAAAEAAPNPAAGTAADPAALAAAALAFAANREGVEQRLAGNFAAARAAYERALGLDPACADAERNLAILHDLYLDDPSAALAHYERYQALTAGTDAEVTAWLVELKARIAAITRTAEAQP